LRSGAPAPDFPFVIFVRLRLPSDSLGRIEVARCHEALHDGLRASRVVALLDLWSGHEIYRVAKPRPRGRPRLAFVLLIAVRGRFALMRTGFLVGPQSGGGAVMGGAWWHWLAHAGRLARRPSGAGGFVGFQRIRAVR